MKTSRTVFLTLLDPASKLSQITILSQPSPGQIFASWADDGQPLLPWPNPILRTIRDAEVLCFLGTNIEQLPILTGLFHAAVTVGVENVSALVA